MFVFGHTGIGRTIAAPFARGLPERWILAGTLLPDVIDKPLYYGMKLLTGLSAVDIGLISGTRTFGHTGVLMIAFSALAALFGSRPAAALALGSATHLLLDALLDLSSGGLPWENGVVVAILFPFAGFRFPITPHADATANAWSLVRPEILVTEIVGNNAIICRLLRSTLESSVTAGPATRLSPCRCCAGRRLAR
mgnify:CR=1 FL=1